MITILQNLKEICRNHRWTLSLCLIQLRHRPLKPQTLLPTPVRHNLQRRLLPYQHKPRKLNKRQRSPRADQSRPSCLQCLSYQQAPPLPGSHTEIRSSRLHQNCRGQTKAQTKRWIEDCQTPQHRQLQNRLPPVLSKLLNLLHHQLHRSHGRIWFGQKLPHLSLAMLQLLLSFRMS